MAGKGEIASFGQLLPLIFLVLPLFSAYGSYIGRYPPSSENTPCLRSIAEEKDRKRELDERHESGYTFIVVVTEFRAFQIRSGHSDNVSGSSAVS